MPTCVYAMQRAHGVWRKELYSAAFTAAVTGAVCMAATTKRPLRPAAKWPGVATGSTWVLRGSPGGAGAVCNGRRLCGSSDGVPPLPSRQRARRRLRVRRSLGASRAASPGPPNGPPSGPGRPGRGPPGAAHPACTSFAFRYDVSPTSSRLQQTHPPPDC